jgi:hypothetical protein
LEDNNFLQSGFFSENVFGFIVSIYWNFQFRNSVLLLDEIRSVKRVQKRESLDGSIEFVKMRTIFAAIRSLEYKQRSKLAELRTGISVPAISLSNLTVLISTSPFWDSATETIVVKRQKAPKLWD